MQLANEEAGAFVREWREEERGLRVQMIRKSLTMKTRGVFLYFCRTVCHMVFSLGKHLIALLRVHVSLHMHVRLSVYCCRVRMLTCSMLFASSIYCARLCLHAV